MAVVRVHSHALLRLESAGQLAGIAKVGEGIQQHDRSQGNVRDGRFQLLVYCVNELVCDYRIAGVRGMKPVE